MAAIAVLAFLATIAGVYATGIVLAVQRAHRDKLQSGFLNVHDGATFLLEENNALAAHARRAGYSVQRVLVPLMSAPVTRVTVSGVELAREMGFRLVGLTRATERGLAGRLVVDGTKNPKRATRLFGRDEVKEALQVLCGAQAAFKQINLYPGGDLIIDVLDVTDGPVDDLVERLLRFCEAIDAAAPHLDTDRPQLGSTSGTSSSAAFSIEIRS